MVLHGKAIAQHSKAADIWKLPASQQWAGFKPRK